MTHIPFPAAYYRNNETRLVLDDADAASAKADGWSDRPPSAPEPPVVEPVLAPMPEVPADEPHARPRGKKKAETSE